MSEVASELPRCPECFMRHTIGASCSTDPLNKPKLVEIMRELRGDAVAEFDNRLANFSATVWLRAESIKQAIGEVSTDEAWRALLRTIKMQVEHDLSTESQS